MTVVPQDSESINSVASSAWAATGIALLALIIGFYCQWQALGQRFVINGDVPQHIYWMQQFNDPELYQNDLLTHFAKSLQPWGAVVIYRVLAPIIDPLLLSKVLPIFLSAASAVYLFKLLALIAGGFAGMVGASLFLVMPVFAGVMAGGTPRAYSFLVLASFLYYLIKHDYRKLVVVIVLQPLLYPSMFFLCGVTFFLTFLRPSSRDLSPKMVEKLTCFVLSMILGVGILGTKYLLLEDASLGKMVTSTQVETWPELSIDGRYSIIPTGSLAQALVTQTRGIFMSFISVSPIYIAARELKPASLAHGRINTLIWIAIPGLLLIVLLFTFWGKSKSGFVLPTELMLLLLASLIMFELAELLFLRLWLPSRYVQYSLPLLCVAVVSLAIGRLIARIRATGVRLAIQTAVIAVLLLHFNINQGVALDNQSDKHELFNSLAAVSKDALIAAHPMLADYIPTFSKRKVFLNHEMSQPFKDRYWFVLRARTFEFFDAYYAEDISKVAQFCRKHKIDYLVVDRRHFTAEFLSAKRLYFEPFNSYLKNLTRQRSRYALSTYSGERKEVLGGNVYIIDVRALGN